MASWLAKLAQAPTQCATTSGLGCCSPSRTESGYRCYSHADLGHLLFIRRAKLLGLSLEEIPALLGLAQKRECQSLRQEVAELLRQKLDQCVDKLAELTAFKASLEERYQLALQHRDQPGCACACLPVEVQEVTERRTEAVPASMGTP